MRDQSATIKELYERCWEERRRGISGEWVCGGILAVARKP